MIRSLPVLFLFASFAHAELPPGSYNTLRAEAPDAVIIQVTGVQEANAGIDAKQVSVEAKVLGVERSKSELKVGDTVTIQYRVSRTPIPGPRPTPVLQKNAIYPAFLKKTADGFVPAAYGMSFKMTPD